MKVLFSIRFAALFLLLATVTIPRCAVAAMIGDADVPYHAERTVLFKGQHYTGPVWAVPGKQRHEQMINGIKLVVILRADTGLVDVILPDLNVYTQFPMSNDLDMSILGAPVGHGIVDDRRATKYRLQHRESDGTGGAGWLWIGPHHILLKLTGYYRTEGGNTVPVTAALSQVVTGPQDPSLFDIPANMTALPIDAITPFLGLKGN